MSRIDMQDGLGLALDLPDEKSVICLIEPVFMCGWGPK
jgi:hypothetical protein